MGLLRKGLRALLRGDISKIQDWFVEQIRTQLGEETVVEEIETPSWMTSTGQQTIVRHTRIDANRFEGRESEWVSILPSLSFSIESPERFDRVDFPVINASSALEVTVEGRFSTESGGVIADTATLTNRQSRDVGFSVPVSIASEEPVHEVEVDITVEYRHSLRNISSLLKREKEYKPWLELRPGQPAPRPTDTSQSPIFLISIDALRFDRQDELEPLISSFEGDATIPSEPRTQGHWTPVSHGCMFTGLHPGEHGFIGTYGDGWPQPIHRNATTLPEILSDQLYKCSALVCNPNILPEWGFGRGFHRYQLKKLQELPDGKNDAAEQVNTIIDWVDRDVREGSNNLFYFLHILDPHTPAVPPFPFQNVSDTDIDSIFEYAQTSADVKDYVEILEEGLDIDDDLIDIAIQTYDETVAYTAEQVARLIEHLKRRDIYDDALIIITGDHGEEFGERNFHNHNSLYDANIRPFTLVKPPVDASWTVPEHTNTIDFLPTIARTVGESPPTHCQGTAWQNELGNREPRIIERIHWDWYNVSVEEDGVKAIFTYPSNHKERPPKAVIEDGPVVEEYYRLAQVREGRYEQCKSEISQERRQLFLDRAESFIATTHLETGDNTATSNQTVPEDVEDRLDQLGYK